MNVLKITNVVPKENLTLIVSFSDGAVKNYDCKHVAERNEYYQRLKDHYFFKNVHIDTGGHGLSWDDHVDLSEYEILQNGSDIA